MPSASISASTRDSSAGAGEAVQRAVVADVLAGGQARVDAAGVGEHADPPPHLVAVAHDVVPGDLRGPGVGDDQRREHPQQRRLAGAVGPEQRR